MPIVQITMIKGRSEQQIASMYREVTDAIHRSTGAPKEAVRIMLLEVEPSRFAVAGVAKTGPSS